MLNEIKFKKYSDGLVPVIIQSALDSNVLMLGYMNEEAYLKTEESGKVWFYSRSKQRLWMKGESSGNSLSVVSKSLDCDQDAILIKVIPAGPTCHLGDSSCFKSNNFNLKKLENIIEARLNQSQDYSYTKELIEKGINKVAQKVGEEATEVVIAALNEKREDFIYESADLCYHLLVLLKAKGVKLEEIYNELEGRWNERERS